MSLYRVHYRNDMRPLPKGHPARPKRLYLYQTRRRIDWCELGWRVAPYACAAAVFVLVYVLGRPS
jgi:hypothetical protein